MVALGRRGCMVQSSSVHSSGSESMWRGLHSPRSAIPEVKTSEPRAPGDTAQDLVVPPGQALAGRTQDSNDAPATRWPPNCAVWYPLPQEHPSPYRLRAAVITPGADSGVAELVTATIVVPPAGTYVPGTKQGPHKINSSH